jgi:hypothetical protein
LPFANPAKGGLAMSAHNIACNTLSGWFVIDKVSYVGETITELDLRFEQHCYGMAPALRGQLHWTAPPRM